jgi:hypothetical protein
MSSDSSGEGTYTSNEREVWLLHLSGGSLAVASAETLIISAVGFFQKYFFPPGGFINLKGLWAYVGKS